MNASDLNGTVSQVLRLRNLTLVRYLAYIGLWLAVFFAGAWPAWKAAYRNADRIAAADTKIEVLTSMAAAGAWFNAAAANWEPVQREVYDRHFPRVKDREQLFLEVARVAREADIDPFELREVAAAVDRPTDTNVDELAVSPEEAQLAQLVEQFATDIDGLPGAELHTYRLQAAFEADYARMARFFAHLETIPRALTLHTLAASSGRSGIRVTLELDFYVQPAHQN